MPCWMLLMIVELARRAARARRCARRPCARALRRSARCPARRRPETRASPAGRGRRRGSGRRRRRCRRRGSPAARAATISGDDQAAALSIASRLGHVAQAGGACAARSREPRRDGSQQRASSSPCGHQRAGDARASGPGASRTSSTRSAPESSVASSTRNLDLGLVLISFRRRPVSTRRSNGSRRFDLAGEMRPRRFGSLRSRASATQATTISRSPPSY